jgi:uncharacterized membrane protein YhaH (DUF805 family)
MTFGESISTCLKKYAAFDGRASRSELWWFFLFSFLVQAAGSIIGTVVAGVLGLVLLLPGLAVSVRRLHDIGKSGWFILVGLIPLIGWVILLYWYVQPGTAGANDFGDADNAAAA